MADTFISRQRDIFTGKTPIGKGFESLVYTSRTKEYVVKIPNIELQFNEHKRTPAFIDWLSSQAHGKELASDHKKVKAVFGDNLLSTHFFTLNHPITGKESFAQVQKNFEVEGYKEWSKIPMAKKKEILSDLQSRESTLDFLWKIKKYCVVFGVPFDLEAYGNNIAYNEGAKHFIVIEAGFPTELVRILNDKEYLPSVFSREAKEEGISRMLNEKIPLLRKFDTSLQVTQHEMAMLNKKHFHDESFDFDSFLDELVRKFEKIKSQVD